MHELYKTHRPKSFKQMVGQKEIIEILKEMVMSNKVPHALLLSGPSGCGKTTVARILKNKLNCSQQDFLEINCADFRGIDTVRDIRVRMMQAPIKGDCRIWLIDEAHKLSGDAQNAFLKMMEDTPRHIYFILCTTDPNKLLKTIRTRCTELSLKLIPTGEMRVLLQRVSNDEQKKVGEEVIDKIIEVAEGSARKALVLLDQVLHLKTDEERVEAVLSSSTTKQAIDLARALINPGSKWPDVASILSKIEEEPEQIRYLVLGYASSVLLKGGKGPIQSRAYCLINAFRDNFYDSKKAGLIAACYEIICGA